jgi:hypothetical protein
VVFTSAVVLSVEGEKNMGIDREMELIEAKWVFDDELHEWVLIAVEPAPRGSKEDTITHWMKDVSFEPRCGTEDPKDGEDCP